MLAVDGEQPLGRGPDLPRDEVAAGDQRLLIGERDRLPRVQRRKRRQQTSRADQGVQDEVAALVRGGLHDGVRAGREVGAGRRLVVGQHRKSRRELVYLLGQQLGVPPGDERDNLELVPVLADDIERLRADATRRAEDRDPLHRDILPEGKVIRLGQKTATRISQ